MPLQPTCRPKPTRGATRLPGDPCTTLGTLAVTPQAQSTDVIASLLKVSITQVQSKRPQVAGKAQNLKAGCLCMLMTCCELVLLPCFLDWS